VPDRCHPDASAPREPRKPYTPPEVVTYGTVSEPTTWLHSDDDGEIGQFL
jgi:hypothetical protein